MKNLSGRPKCIIAASHCLLKKGSPKQSFGSDCIIARSRKLKEKAKGSLTMKKIQKAIDQGPP